MIQLGHWFLEHNFRNSGTLKCSIFSSKIITLLLFQQFYWPSMENLVIWTTCQHWALFFLNIWKASLDLSVAWKPTETVCPRLLHIPTHTLPTEMKVPLCMGFQIRSCRFLLFLSHTEGSSHNWLLKQKIFPMKEAMIWLEMSWGW